MGMFNNKFSLMCSLNRFRICGLDFSSWTRPHLLVDW